MERETFPFSLSSLKFLQQRLLNSHIARGKQHYSGSPSRALISPDGTGLHHALWINYKVNTGSGRFTCKDCKIFLCLSLRIKSEVCLSVISESCTKLGLNTILVWPKFMNMSAFARDSEPSMQGQADGSVYNHSSWLVDTFGFRSGP